MIKRCLVKSALSKCKILRPKHENAFDRDFEKTSEKDKEKKKNMSVIVSLMGGLGFFLYGMKLMSEGLQKVAGSKMREAFWRYLRRTV